MNYTNSSLLAFSLINKCVDTILNINQEINTNNYVLDLSSINTLNKKGIDSFLDKKNINLPVTHDDSVMIIENDDIETFHMKQSMIIRIKEISAINATSVSVTISKIRSSREIINTYINLDRVLEGYEINHVQAYK